MDSRGWVPIPLIASFNRVKRLTQDINLVRDALALSSLVEVKDDYVRLSNDQWKQWVLPQAPRSIVEDGGGGLDVLQLGHEERSGKVQVADEGEIEEDEEDDVVFVLDRNVTNAE